MSHVEVGKLPALDYKRLAALKASDAETENLRQQRGAAQSRTQRAFSGSAG